jgi:uncharacterized delta-60 repeat protein
MDRRFGRRGIRLLPELAGPPGAGQTTRYFSISGGALGLQRDGGIVIGGERWGGRKNWQPWVARLHANGSLDRGFAHRGWRTVDFGDGRGDDGFYRLEVQRDGRIIAMGSTFRAPGKGRFAFARFLPNGRLDPTFSGDGTTAVEVARGGANHAAAMALDRRGRIVATGYAFGRDIFVPVLRLTRTGRLDRSFSKDGRRRSALGIAEAIVTDRHNRIIVAGQNDQDRRASGHGTGHDFMILRLLESGSPDRSFSGDGRKLVAFGNGKGFDAAYALGMFRGGRIVVAGESVQPHTGSDAAITRLLP